MGVIFTIFGFFWILNRLATPPEKTQETAAKAAHKKALLDAMLEAELNGNKERADYLNDVLLNYWNKKIGYKWSNLQPMYNLIAIL